MCLLVGLPVFDVLLVRQVALQFEALFLICNILAYSALTVWSYSERNLQDDPGHPIAAGSPALQICSDASVLLIYTWTTGYSFFWDAVRSAAWKRRAIRIAMYSAFIGNCVRVLVRERFVDDFYSSRSLCFVYCVRVCTLALGALVNIASFYVKYLLISILFPARPAVLRMPMRRHVLSATLQRCSTVVPASWAPNRDLVDAPDVESERMLEQQSVLSGNVPTLAVVQVPMLSLTLSADGLDGHASSSPSAVPLVRGVVADAVPPASRSFESPSPGNEGSGARMRASTVSLYVTDVVARRPLFGARVPPMTRVCRVVVYGVASTLALVAVLIDRVGWARDANGAMPAIVAVCVAFAGALLQVDVLILRLLVRQFESLFVAGSCVTYVAAASVAKLQSQDNDVNSGWSVATTALLTTCGVSGALLLDTLSLRRRTRVIFLCALEGFIASEFVLEAVAPRMVADEAVCLLTCGSLKSLALGALLNIGTFVAKYLVLAAFAPDGQLTVVRILPQIVTN